MASKHILAERPLAKNESEGRKMVKTIEKNEVRARLKMKMFLKKKFIEIWKSKEVEGHNSFIMINALKNSKRGIPK